MAERDPAMHDNMAPLSQLSDYEVADDSVDVRGWKVTGSSGTDIGKVDDLIVDPSTMQARYLAVQLDPTVHGTRADVDDTLPVLVPVSRANIHEDDKRVHLDSSGAGLAQLPRYRGHQVDRDYNDVFSQTEAPGAAADPGTHRLTRSAEELRIGKRNIEAGEVKVRKHVETEHVSEPVTRTREVVHVDRRPVSGDSAAAGELRDDEIRVPITEEEVVVDKRPVVKEELVISKERISETENVEADLRKEKIDVDGDHLRQDRSSTKRRGV
jgi:uncharacterized protein (TIGR02271 family)